MALTISSNFARSTTIKLLGEKFAAINLTYNSNQIRERHILNPKPRLRNPTWFTKQMKVKRDELITRENEAFIQQAVQDKYTNVAPKEEIPTNVEWSPKYQRTGVIARKIGVYPLWLKTGEKIQTTLLEILDNHVVKHYLPEEYDPPRKKPKLIVNKKTCLILGAGAGDPTLFTREYCGLFNESGVIPKKILARFFVSPEAALPLGTLITAKHFQVGNTVDIRGKTIDRGFQGVMKRHGFKGMPASHGVTKTHRRPGNIGGGGEKGRVWPGTKLPGHMGNTWRIAKGLKILRMNTKHNVIWVSGQAIPGETNSICYVFDTNLPLRKPEKPVPFPTYFQTESEEVPEDIYDESIHRFDDPSIIFREQK